MSIVRMHALPPMSWERASAQKTPLTPIHIGKRRVKGRTSTTFLKSEKNTALQGQFRATNVFCPEFWKLMQKKARK